MNKFRLKSYGSAMNKIFYRGKPLTDLFAATVMTSNELRELTTYIKDVGGRNIAGDNNGNGCPTLRYVRMLTVTIFDPSHDSQRLDLRKRPYVFNFPAYYEVVFKMTDERAPHEVYQLERLTCSRKQQTSLLSLGFTLHSINQSNFHPDALFNIGWAYEGGVGVERDLIKAEEFYRLAADRGHVSARQQLGESGGLNQRRRVQKEETHGGRGGSSSIWIELKIGDRIRVFSGRFVDAIEINGVRYGGEGGQPSPELTISGPLVGIRGRNGSLLDQIQFRFQDHITDAFGGEGGGPFEIDGEIVAIGIMSEKYINALGVKYFAYA